MNDFEYADPSIWKPNPNDVREDGTEKGYGFLGVLKRPNDEKGISSEISIGISPEEVGYDPEKHKGYKLLNSENGKYLSVPTMVPALDKKEIGFLLSTPEDKLDNSHPIMKSIRKKAVEFAKSRMREGKPFFAEEHESPRYGNPMGALEKIKYDMGL